MPAKRLAIWLSRQRALPYRLRRSLIKRIHPAMLRDFPFETAFYGLRFRGNIINYIDRLIYFCGAHEKYMLHFLRDFTKRLKQSENTPATFVDVGANAGNHSLFMASLVDKVHAFEPFGRVRTQLLENIAINQLKNIEVHPFGLGDADASLPFYAPPEANLGAASFMQDGTNCTTVMGHLPLRKGDAVVSESGIKNIRIVKADVEGFERHVLEGLRQTLLRDRPLLVIELSPKTRATLSGADEFFALFPPRYRFYYFAVGKVDSGVYRLAPFDYALTPHVQDVICCPEELTGSLTL